MSNRECMHLCMVLQIWVAVSLEYATCQSDKNAASLTARLPVQVGGEFAVSVAEQQRQMDALKTLDAGLSSAALVNPAAFEVRIEVCI